MSVGGCDIDLAGKAFSNFYKSIRAESALPESVFCRKWKTYLFFQSDWLIDASFVEFVRLLLVAERSNCAALINISRTDSFKWNEAAVYYFNVETKSADYEVFLRGNGPDSGWLYTMDKYACTSDIGRWCFYSERDNDVAVMALDTEMGGDEFRSALQLVKASSLEIASGPNGVFPFNALTQEWRRSLFENYG